ncbi:selenium cofactor biosynthesis protein YqeC [Romboutsia sp.]|uniref:selenium cofactor biosynthesis protein YqeC n=1 Tax=Romboutsia sp. TaxID=1965302 RepID=UPI003F31A71D
MELYKIVEKNKNEIITVVGAGGKTSIINYLADYYRNELRVLLTTTTKIYVPQKESYDCMFMVKDNKNIELNKESSVVVCGKHINYENKIIGLDFNDLISLTPQFDLVLIEGDGSKRKKLKGWRENEPLVYPKSTKTIAILDITSYSLDIRDENIHRLEEFKKLTQINSTKVTITNLKDIVLNEQGLFKKAKGKKILFINKVEGTYYEDLAEKLIKEINKEKHDISIMYGSIKQGTIKEVIK